MNERLRSLGNEFKLALDVLEYDESVEDAIQYACNNAVVATTLSAARQLTFVDKEKVLYTHLHTCSHTLVHTFINTLMRIQT